MEEPGAISIERWCELRGAVDAWEGAPDLDERLRQRFGLGLADFQTLSYWMKRIYSDVSLAARIQRRASEWQKVYATAESPSGCRSGARPANR
jgi:hypothetical protein